jgi:hypothetical protein
MRVSTPKPGMRKVECSLWRRYVVGADTYFTRDLPPGKSDIDVSADYLSKVRVALTSQLQTSLGEVFTREERHIHYYFTIPGNWYDAGQKSLRAAIIQAGYLRDENDYRLSIVTVGEAAALHCLKRSMLDLQVKDVVLIVHCGWEALDLQACELASKSPCSFAEYTSGSGALCGLSITLVSYLSCVNILDSSFTVDQNFRRILSRKLRKMKLPNGSSTFARVFAACAVDFQNRIKLGFKNDGQNWVVNIGNEANFPEADIEKGFITVTNDQILPCFEPVVTGILELIRNQVEAVHALNGTLKVSH